MSDPIVYACIIAALVLGWVACIVCWHRPDRANRQVIYEADIADAHVRLSDLLDELDRAEEGRKFAETEAATYLRKIRELATDKARAVIALDNERAEHRLHQRACASHCGAIERGFWLPTIEGIRADGLDAFGLDMPIGVSLGWNADETPIGAGVVESLAEVVPIRGLS